MSSSDSPPVTFRATLRTFAQDPERPFASRRNEDPFAAAVDRHGVAFARGERHVGNPARTRWTVRSQCVSDSQSGVAAVARALALRVRLGRPPCSEATGAYGKARAKRPVARLSEGATHRGDERERPADPSGQWKTRRVLFAEGTTVSGPDTPAHPAAYPPPATPQKGRGFPRIRMGVRMGFATAARVDARIGPWSGKKAGGRGLFRERLARFRAGEVFVADRAYGSDGRIATLPARGVDVALRMHPSRHSDFRAGPPRGPDDHRGTWPRPARPAGMDQATYRATPKELRVREVRFRVEQPGYRTRPIVVATTLFEESRYSRADLADLDPHRGRVERQIRDLQQTRSMDILRGQTPEMRRREIGGHWRAYHLIRRVMAQAARARGGSPRVLRCAGAPQTGDAFRSGREGAAGEGFRRPVEAMWKAIGGHRVGHRPGRSEPREVNRRPKCLSRMTKARAIRRATLLTEGQER
jgi:hypothetical protein